MIRFAKPSDQPQLTTLWMEAFGDPMTAVETYFDQRHDHNNMLVDIRNGSIAGMLSMLPVSLLTNGGQTFSARYIYAIATRKLYRNLGISTALMQAAHEHVQRLGEAACILVPGGAALFAFYQARDYHTEFMLDELTIRGDALPPLPGNPQHGDCSPVEYSCLRDLAFAGSRLYVRWSARAVAYATQTFAKPGGVMRLRWDGGYGCAAWEQTDTGVLVRELALPTGSVLDALSVLHHALKQTQYLVRLPQGSAAGASLRPFGMIHWLIPEPILSGSAPYLSLAMD